jgi:CheY-like chemotaxis protein
MKKFLIVEDELIPAYVLKTSLVQMGYQTVGLAADGEEALRTVQSLQPDLVFIDLRIEGTLDGFQTLEQLRRFSDIPVVYVGGYTDPETEHRAAQTQCVRLVTKPFDPRQLKEAIAHLRTV